MVDKQYHRNTTAILATETKRSRSQLTNQEKEEQRTTGISVNNQRYKNVPAKWFSTLIPT
jgi:hypothetical protein